MLTKELIVRHVGPQGSVHERGIRLTETQVPPGVATRHDGDEAVALMPGDLLLVSASIGLGLPERIDTDLPVGATVVLVFEVEASELPMDRVLAALAVAKLQVVETAVVSDAPEASVAVVAIRADEPVVPAPSSAQDLEPGDHTGPSHLGRLLSQMALESLVTPARERAFRVQVGELQARLGEVTTELEQTRVDRQSKVAALVSARDTARREANAARKEAEAERKRMQSLRSSTSFKLASRLAKLSGGARQVIRRARPGKAPK